ncbi:hypothetical protein HBO10_23940 [Pseudomonas sp. WS 5503]|uniref:hypothetical protein n=1 Tax=Pseudomonas TaxID=286 RepID=UPI001474392D|nr:MULTISPECIES: hypothetical protein [Pseudomonas]MBF6042959.1 hypothetical protein [Pseudomonas mucoides]NMX82579.1 hypothetical protein [Pseudomonas sp. WS 5503]NNB23850.1 hypothetical protein [Pseudomonas fragi]
MSEKLSLPDCTQHLLIDNESALAKLVGFLNEGFSFSEIRRRGVLYVNRGRLKVGLEFNLFRRALAAALPLLFLQGNEGFETQQFLGSAENYSSQEREN